MSYIEFLLLCSLVREFYGILINCHKSRGPGNEADTKEGNNCEGVARTTKTCSSLYIQWNIRKRDTLGLIVLSLVERLSLSQRVPYHCILRGYGRNVCVREYDYRYTSTYQVSDCVQAGTVLYSSISRDKHHTRLK